MPSSAGGWRGQGSPGGDERSEHALDAADRRRNRSYGPPPTRIRPDRVPSSRRAGSVKAEPAVPGSVIRSARHVAMRRTHVSAAARPCAPSAACVCSARVADRPRHWITWSACSNSDDGTVRPSALAVVRLITNSSCVGCCMGRSAGLAPLKILSTKAAARR